MLWLVQVRPRREAFPVSVRSKLTLGWDTMESFDISGAPCGTIGGAFITTEASVGSPRELDEEAVCVRERSLLRFAKALKTPAMIMR